MSDDEDSDIESNNFLQFQWEVDGEIDSTQSQSKQEASLSLRDVLNVVEVTSLCCGGDDELHSIVQQISIPDLHDVDSRRNNECIICNIINLRGRNHVVQQSMGSMAQCRGSRGEALREAGAIRALLDNLWRLMVHVEGDNCFSLPRQLELNSSPSEEYFDNLCDNHLPLQLDNPDFSDKVLNEFEVASLDLENSCLGALRDLACGSALNRSAILEWTPPCQPQYREFGVENGVLVLSAYVKRYDQWTWEEILSLKRRVGDTSSTQDRGKKEMRLLTNALGAVRNASHSTPDVCQAFYNHGLVGSLVRRLLPQQRSVLEDNTQTATATTVSTSLLPNASCPWREACFRAAGSLINLAEKCPHVAHQLGSNRECIHLLIETWGGASAMNIDPKKTNNASTRDLPLVHLGLAAILHAAENGALAGGLDAIMLHVLENEKIRKRIAQRREEERKYRQTKTLVFM
ncbi:hypothetical protein ACHAXH_003359 [Discostella pseudostelligera]|jgi:hypothetical protein